MFYVGGTKMHTHICHLRIKHIRLRVKDHSTEIKVNHTALVSYDCYYASSRQSDTYIMTSTYCLYITVMVDK